MASAGHDFQTIWQIHTKLLRDRKRSKKLDRRDLEHESANLESLSPSRSLFLPPAAKYQYTRLRNPETYIRLVELQPGHHEDLIICHLREISLEASANQYDALSYAWGDSTDLLPIQVDDGNLNIGSSLHCALQNLRYQDRPRLLWVDAICIDQSDISERNSQVPLMCEIYRHAIGTVCFLGPNSKTTAVMFAMLEELAEEGKSIKKLEVDASAKNGADSLPSFVNHVPVRPITTDVSRKYQGDSTIIDIAECSWWHRAWTVQELLLSPRAMMVFGRRSISFEDLCAAVDHGLNTQIWGPVHYGFVVNPVVVPYLSMRVLMSHYRSHKSQSSAVDLLTLLIHCRHRESTDARDKVYAVLGLLRDKYPEALETRSSNALDIALGYNYDVAFVYRKLSQEIILKTGNLDLLGVCPKTSLSLPTWATDWSNTDRIGSPLTQDSLDRARTTHATNNTVADARFSGDGHCMIVNGQKLTMVSDLADTRPLPILINSAGSTLQPQLKRSLLDLVTMPDFEAMIPKEQGVFKCYLYLGRLRIYIALFTYICTLLFKGSKLQWEWMKDDFQSIMSVFRVVFAWEHFARVHQATNPGGTSDDVYWQTLCGGTYENGNVDKTRQMFLTWHVILQPLRKFMDNHSRVVERFPLIGLGVYLKATWQTYGEMWPYTSCSQRRRLGRASNGWLCLFPEDTNVGDVVILARGGRVPLVIRSDEHGINTIIGEAYIHGIMDGEAFDETECSSIEIR